MLRDAIAGNADVQIGGEMVLTGFKNDVGRWPRDLVELATKDPFTGIYVGRIYQGKEVLPDWDPYLKKGWNGPYVREDGNMGYCSDAWGTDYILHVVGVETLGLRSAGADQMFYHLTPGANDSDDIWVMF